MRGKIFEIKIRVRWNELDANGHVNNMYYHSYFDEARGDTFSRAGMDIEKMREQGIGPVLYRCEFDYERELKHPDIAVIRSRVERIDSSRAVIHQELIRESDGKVVCRAVSYGMFFDFKLRRSVSIPDAVLDSLGIV